MKYFIIALLLLPAMVHAVEYKKLNIESSRITFISTQMSVPVSGVFKKFGGNVRMNSAHPETGMAKISIELASIDAGSEEANDEVKGKSWFNVSEYPAANFVLSSVKSLGGGRYEAAGNLTIKGKTLAVHAPFTLQESNGGLVVDGSLPVKRLEFGIGSGLWGDTSVVANEVEIRFHLVLQQ